MSLPLLRTIVVVALAVLPIAALRDGLNDRDADDVDDASAYSNPVIPGDHPDPSIIRVGDTYWATATTSQWAPIFPLLMSRDLVTWTQVGSVFAKPPAWSAGSYWAPEIAEDRGRFFVYYTARKKDGPLCVAVATADAPRGPYTDRGPLVCQEAGSIDAVPITDEHGTRYLVWKEDGNSRKQPTPLWAQPLSADGATLTGEPREILRNEASWEAHLVEGPFLLRRDGYFYLFYSADACCGRRCNYKLGVARARTLLGPYERNRANPILAGNETWKCPGHGSLVAESGGRTFLLYHAYDAKDFQYAGRQALLDEVAWGADGWPTINQGHGPTRTAMLPASTINSASASSSASPSSTSPSRQMVWPFSDEFTTPDLLPGWQWPYDREPTYRLEPARVGWLVLGATGSDDSGLGSLLAQPALSGDYVTTARIDLSGLPAGVRAGLVAYGDHDNALGATTSRQQVVLWLRDKGKERIIATEEVTPGRAIYLQMTARSGSRFQFATSPDGQRWQPLGPTNDGGSLPPWDHATRIALTAAGPEGTYARFDWLRITTATEPVRSRERR
jgi:beta-xylosidase